jgi:hypothetical protein
MIGVGKSFGEILSQQRPLTFLVYSVSILFNHKNSIIKNQTFHLEPLNQQKW